MPKGMIVEYYHQDGKVEKVCVGDYKKVEDPFAMMGVRFGPEFVGDKES